MVAKSLITYRFCRIVFIRALTRRNLALATGFRRLISGMMVRSQRSAFLVLALLSTIGTAHGECISPSTEAGSTQTTVYRCPVESPAQAKQPMIVSPEKSTVVERGSADVPWFEPNSSRTQIELTLTPDEKKKPKEAMVPPTSEEAMVPPKSEEVTASPKSEEATLPPKSEEVTTPEIKPLEKPEPKVKRAESRKKKIAKKKTAVKKLVKAKSTKVQAAKVKPAKEAPKEEADAGDDKVIVWTRKDMTLGKRIGSWLGL